MINNKLELKDANIIRLGLQKSEGQNMRSFYTTLLLGVLMCFVSSLISPVLAQQEEGANDTTTSVNVDASIYSDEFQGFSPYLTSKQVNVFGDFSVQEALIRVPGIQASRDGEINIRGVRQNAYSVTVDGIRLANTGFGSRNIDLGALSTDSFSDIQVIKVLDPSMDADALGGTINLKTKQPTGNTRKVSAIVGGGANTAYLSRSGPSSRGWINYQERFNDKVSLAANLNYQNEQFAREELILDYNAIDFGGELVDVPERVSPSLQNDDRGRFAASIATNFTPTENSSYFLSALVNSESRKRVKHQDNWVANGDWIDAVTTGDEGEQGTYSHEGQHQNIDITQFAFQAGGENEFESLKLNYSGGWTQSRSKNRDYLFPFQIGELNYSVDMSDRTRPQMEITNRPLQVLENGTVDRQFLIAENFDRTTEEHINDQLSARADVEYPINIGSVKAGTSFRLSLKEGEFDEHSFEYYRSNLRMINFNMMKEPIRNIDIIDDDYRLPWFIHTDYARDFLEDQRPLFSSDENTHAYNSEIKNYKNSEQIYAAYAMGDLEFGKLQVKGGVRVEQTISSYDGNSVVFDETGELESSSDTEQTNNDLQLFPNAQLSFSPSNHNRIQLAFSRTMDRPDYYWKTPFERIDNQDSLIYRGNYQLEPVFSNNIDLIAEQQFANSGIFSVAGFYKELSNFIVQRSRSLSSGQYNEYQERTFENSDQTASIYGIELAMQQSLEFLPGLLNNFGVYANYTWSQSNFETQREEDTALPGQSPHVVNAALSYTQGRFFGQVKYHWSAELLTHLAEDQQAAPAIGANPVYMDRYEDGYQDLSATINFQLSERFMFWAHANNLLPAERREYENYKQFYPTSTYIKEGIELRLGVRFEM